DGYNKSRTWMNFQGLFLGTGYSWMRNSYRDVLSLAPGKPMMIGETASVEAGDGGAKKAQWFRYGLGTELSTYMPQVKAYLYMNWNINNASNTYPVQSTNAALAGFADGISSPYFATNRFGALSGSPLQPPGP